MFPKKIQKWLDKDLFPQRVMLSGAKGAFRTAVQIASVLQQVPVASIEKSVHSDTAVFRDEGNSFKIGENDQDSSSVRGLIKWSAQKPTAPYRLMVLENLERASRDAPQALLKLIEEPPPLAMFLFTTQNHHQILDTILSRMIVVRLADPVEDFEVSDDVRAFLYGKDLIEQFQKIEELITSAKENKKEKKTVLNFLQELLLQARFFEEKRIHLSDIFETYQAIRQNVNHKLALERLALKLANE